MFHYHATIWLSESYFLPAYTRAEDIEAATINLELAYPQAVMMVVEPKSVSTVSYRQ